MSKLGYYKKWKSHIKIVNFEVENLKLKICFQILKLIENKIVLRTKLVWHWVDAWVVEPGS